VSFRSRTCTGQNKRISAARLTARILGFGVLWSILSGFEGWHIGVPAVLIASAALPIGTPADRWSLAGLARLLPYFLWNSLRGGVDVAVRALHPGLPINPGILHYEMRLQSPAARVLMANTVTLLPGTLSADLKGNDLSVHVLNTSGPVRAMLVALEQRVGDLVRPEDEARTE
jgi:multicomponent Na+:H+ antiporter subunit E